MKRTIIAAIFTLTFAASSIYAVEQTAFRGAGVIESTAGGFMFPDGTVQVTASDTTEDCTPITAVGTAITAPGVYCFVGNLSATYTGGSGITISSDNVTINMNGWVLDGLGAGTATETEGIIAHERKNITIRNGTIRGFYMGINLRGTAPYTISRNHLVEDIRAEQNTAYGIRVLGLGSIVRRNQVVSTGGSTRFTSNSAYGIYLTGPGMRALNNDVISTQTQDSAGAAILLQDADGAVVEGNRIDSVTGDTATYGISISDSFDVMVKENTITFSNSGIYYDNSTGKYSGNLTNGTITPFTGGTAVGTNN